MIYRDTDIIKGCKNNDPKYQKLLLEKYAGYLLAVIRRYCTRADVAQDILQESWIQIFKSFKQYEERGLLKGWIAKIAILQCYREIRKSNKIHFVESTPDVPIDIPNAIDNLNYEDLMKIVNKLKSPQRDVFAMKIIDGLNHKEIGAILNIKESTSRAHLTNARKKLQEMIKLTTAML